MTFCRSGISDDGWGARAVRSMPFFALDGSPPGDGEADLVPASHEHVLALRKVRLPRPATVGVQGARNRARKQRYEIAVQTFCHSILDAEDAVVGRGSPPELVAQRERV